METIFYILIAYLLIRFYENNKYKYQGKIRTFLNSKNKKRQQLEIDINEDESKWTLEQIQREETIKEERENLLFCMSLLVDLSILKPDNKKEILIQHSDKIKRALNYYFN